MNNAVFDLLIVDENKLIAPALSTHLYNKFGERVNVSTFFDEESCMRNMNKQSSVIVLDYFLNKEDKNTKRGFKIFNSIRKKEPEVEITMITSNEEGIKAVEEIQMLASDYIVKREHYKKRTLLLLNRLILSPIYTMTISPVKKRIDEYTLQDYLVMFIVAFVAVGSLVILCLRLFR